MKLLLSLILTLLAFSNYCLSQSSSSSSSSSNCPEHYSGVNCDIFNHYAWGYYAALPQSGTIEFLGEFGNVHENLSVKIGNRSCNSVYPMNYFRLLCGIDNLVLYQFYDVEITQNNITWFKENFYSPYISDCGYGTYNMGVCVCEIGWSGQNCRNESLPFVTNATSVSVYGGEVILDGWFGFDPTSGLSIYIGSNKLVIKYFQPYKIIGYITQGPNGVAGTQDITIYDSNNQLVFTGNNMFTFDSNICFNYCFNNGVCNNGVCQCYYPFTGDFCSQTLDSNLCQCSS